MRNNKGDEAENAQGTSPGDFLYDQAESVRRWKETADFVYVTFQGKEYGPCRESWGPLDGDKNKSTTLVQTEDGKWWKLWYFYSDVEWFGSRPS